MKSNLNVAWLWLALKIPQNLTNLYNNQPLELVDAYAQLDAIVAEAYEWPLRAEIIDRIEPSGPTYMYERYLLICICALRGYP